MTPIQFLYWEDCPSHEAALNRLRQVMVEEGIEAAVEIIEIITEDQAHQLHFTGSPTILVYGQDIDPPPDTTPCMLTCRTYQWEDGRISPLPSPDTIRSALRALKED